MTTATPRARGRPALAHDNREVRAFLSDYPSVADLLEERPDMGDVLAAASAAKSPGDTARKPLSVARIFDVLAACEVITTQATASVFSLADRCEATIKRYAQAARTASLFIARQLGRVGSPRPRAD